MSDTKNGPEQPKQPDESGTASVGGEDVIDLDEVVVDATRQSSPQDEWTVAALAHASVLLTLLLVFAGGVGSLVGLAVPLVIYLSYRERSRFVAFHALQSLVYQGAGVLVYIVLLVVSAGGVAVAWTVSGLLSAVIIGLLLIPFALIFTLVIAGILLGAPLLLVGYGLYAAYRVYQGQDFRYVLLGEWLEKEVKV